MEEVVSREKVKPLSLSRNKFFLFFYTKYIYFFYDINQFMLQ
jgi:hypothetical protein